MAISVMNHVWNTASASGSRLLVLLVLADHANELGYAWPEMKTIAQYARIGERQVQRILEEFVHFGDLFMIAAHGRGHRSRYCLLLGVDRADIPTHLMSVFPDDYDAVAAFCADHDLAEPPRIVPVPPKPKRSKKATSGPPIRENPTSMTPLPPQNPTSMTPLPPQNPTSTTPFEEEKPDIDDAFSDENPTSMTPFTEIKPDIAMSSDPSCSDQNLVVVVDQQQRESQPNESEPDPESDLVSYLKNKGMSAADQFADIPYAIGRADFDAQRATGTPISHIVNRWREHRPTTAEEHYGPRTRHSAGNGRNGTGLRDGPADRGTAPPPIDRERALGTPDGIGSRDTGAQPVQPRGSLGDVPTGEVVDLDAVAAAAVAAARERRKTRR